MMAEQGNESEYDRRMGEASGLVSTIGQINSAAMQDKPLVLQALEGTGVELSQLENNLIQLENFVDRLTGHSTPPLEGKSPSEIVGTQGAIRAVNDTLGAFNRRFFELLARLAEQL